MKFWLRACPKCGGDLEQKEDLSGPYTECIQCGGELTPTQERLLHRLGYVPEGLAPMVPPPVLAEGRRHSA